VSVLVFNVERCRGAVVIRWSVKLAAGDLGYNVYRSDIDGPSLERVNAALVRAHQSGISSFEIADTELAPGQSSDYWLEQVDAEGRTRIWGPRRPAGWVG
jgi:hypothetical protein